MHYPANTRPRAHKRTSRPVDVRPPVYDQVKRDSGKSHGKQHGGAYQSDLEALQALVASLESSNSEIMMNIGGLKEEQMQIVTDLETVGSTQMSIMDDLAPVKESIMPLMTDIDSLAMATDPFGVNSVLVADYFFVNDVPINPPRVSDLIEPFCVPESSVLKFELSVSFTATRMAEAFENTNAVLVLVINEQDVAITEF